MAKEKTGFIAGFKEFISRGNAVDLAVGVVIGGAFGKITTTIVNKVLNPLVAGIFGKPNFDNLLAFKIGSALVQPGAVITALINFLLVALAIYVCVVLPINRVNRIREALEAQKIKDEEAQAIKTPSVEENQLALLEEIRDLLATRKL